MRGLAAGLVAGLGLLVPVTGARAQVIEAGPVTVEFTGRLQLQYNTTSVDAEEMGEAAADPVDGTFETRRMRLGVELAFEEWITAKLEPDFAGGGTSLKDAWVNLAFRDAIQLRVGQFKRPFSLIELTSSTQILPIERAVRIRGLESAVPGPLGEEQLLLAGAGYSDRDLGAAVHGALGRWGYTVGVFNGSGANTRDTDDAKSLAGRVTVAPSGSLPLVIGGAVSHQTRGPGGGAIDAADGVVFGLDAEYGAFRRPGLHLMGELVYGDDMLKLTAIDGEIEPATMVGGHFIAAGFFPVDDDRLEGVEVVGRVSVGDPDTDVDDDAGLLFTPGLNLYFSGRNRLMFNWDLYTGDDRLADAQHAFRGQLQVYF